MFNTHVLFLVPLVVVAACGDDASDDGVVDANARVGVFGPRVSGVRYTTSTKSGLTDADGSFSYAAGETVTFALGGVHLGQAAAAETMNVFDLVGANPPTDVDRFLREIGDDLVQPFERGIRSQET